MEIIWVVNHLCACRLNLMPTAGVQRCSDVQEGKQLCLQAGCRTSGIRYSPPLVLQMCAVLNTVLLIAAFLTSPRVNVQKLSEISPPVLPAQGASGSVCLQGLAHILQHTGLPRGKGKGFPKGKAPITPQQAHGSPNETSGSIGHFWWCRA